MKFVLDMFKKHLPKIIIGVIMFLITVTIIKLYKAWRRR